MDLRLTQIEGNIAALAHGPGQVKYSYRCFESKTDTTAQVCKRFIIVLAVVATPAAICESIKKKNFAQQGTGIPVYR